MPGFDLCQVRNPRALSDGKHLKMTLRTGNREWDMIAFGQGYQLENLTKEIDIAYYFDINVWNGRQTMQLNIRDIRPSVNVA